MYSPRSRGIKNYRILRDAGDLDKAWRQRRELGLGSGKFDKAYRAQFQTPASQTRSRTRSQTRSQTLGRVHAT